MTSSACEDVINKALKNKEEIKSVFVDHVSERVIVETSLNSTLVQRLIEDTGRQAVLQGVGSGKGISLRGLGAAVAMVSGDAVQGVVRFVQVDENMCVIEGTIDGLESVNHAVQIHEFGDLSDGCNSCGEVLNPNGASNSEAYGDLGAVQVGKDGRATLRLENELVKVWDIIGRSLVIHNLQTKELSKGGRVACGIIARSSGLFENSKRICACDGVTVWDERNVPVAGPARNAYMKEKLENT